MLIFAYLFVEKFDEFNMAWLRRGHPVLDIGDSSTEASKSLDLLLDQLRYSTVKSLNNSAMIVLINRCGFVCFSCLSTCETLFNTAFQERGNIWARLGYLKRSNL